MARAMILTGGIGSGKSTVAAMLRRWGAHVVDADQLAREVVAPGTDGLDEVVTVFGPRVLAGDGSLDRSVLADLVFGRPEQLARLEAIVHPRVAELAAQRLQERPDAQLVVYEVPLPGRQPTFPGTDFEEVPVVVVDVADRTRRQRLRDRGMGEEQIDARISAQPSRQEWLALADVVLDNSDGLDHLEIQVAALWLELTGSPAPVGAPG